MTLATTRVDPGQSGIGPYLDHFVINTTVEQQELDVAPLVKCIAEPHSADSDAGYWSAICAVTNPQAVVRIVVNRHGTEDDVHYHVLVFFDVATAPDDDATGKSWEDIIRCLGDAYPQELECTLTARATFPKDGWSTVLGLPKAATGLMPDLSEGTVMLAGVDLDLTKTKLPLDGVYVSVRDEALTVALRYQRRLELQATSGLQLLREAEDLARLFVIESKQEIDREPVES